MMRDLLQHLIALTLVSSVSAVVVLSTRHWIRHAFGASVAYRAWLLVPIAMLALFIPGARDAGYEFVIQEQVGPMSTLVTITESFSAAGSSIDWQAWLIGGWGVGIALFVTYIIGLQRAFVRGLGKLSHVEGTLRAETAAGCPALLGVLRPKIVLPGDFESRYTAQEQALILAHENVHLRRLDSLWNALTAVMRSVFWFNPLIHVAANCMRADQELACDAAVIERHPASRRTYAGAMLKTQLADTALPVGCHWTSTHPFKERLEMIKTEIPTRARRALGGGLLAIASVVVGYAAWAAEPALTPSQPGTQPAAQPSVQPTVQPGAQPESQSSAQPAPQRPGTVMFSLRREPGAEGGPGEMTRKGVAKIAGDVVLQTSATTVTPGPNGQQILEGDVRITIPKPPGAKGKNVLVRRTPGGADVVTENDAPQMITLRAQKVVLTPLQGGDVQLEWENGTVEPGR